MAPLDRNSRSLEDRRGAYRCSVAGARRWGRLHFEALQLPVEVLDESVGGFAVAMDGLCKFELGSLLWLEIETDRIAVRLVNVDLQDVGVERFEGMNLRSRSRLGLQREPDARPWLNHKSPVYAGWARLRTSRIHGVPWGLIGAGAAFLSALAVVVIVLTRDVKRAKPFNPLARGAGEHQVREIDSSLELAPDHQWTVDQFADQPTGPVKREGGNVPRGFGSLAGGKRVEDKTVSLEVDEPIEGGIQRGPRAAKDKTISLEQQGEHDEPAERAERPGGTTAKAEERLVETSSEEQPLEIVRQAQPELLLRPDVGAALKLSNSQKAHLRRLVLEVRTARVEPGVRDRPETPDERLLRRGRLALAVLTAQQRKQLANMDLAPAEGPAQASGN